MRKDSPVLAALEGFEATCRHPDCNHKFSPLEVRWFPWGGHGYCSNNCWQRAIEEYQSSARSMNSLAIWGKPNKGE